MHTFFFHSAGGRTHAISLRGPLSIRREAAYGRGAFKPAIVASRFAPHKQGQRFDLRTFH